MKNLLIIAHSEAQIATLKRITSHFSPGKVTAVQTVVEAETELLRSRPNNIIIDISDLASSEIQRRLEEFLLGIPGWVRIFFVDSNPTRSRIFRASRLGVNGVLRAPLSHHGITQLLGDEESASNDEESGAQ